MRRGNQRAKKVYIDVVICFCEAYITGIQFCFFMKARCNFLELFDDMYAIITSLTRRNTKLSFEELTFIKRWKLSAEEKTSSLHMIAEKVLSSIKIGKPINIVKYISKINRIKIKLLDVSEKISTQISCFVSDWIFEWMRVESMNMACLNGSINCFLSWLFTSIKGKMLENKTVKMRVYFLTTMKAWLITYWLIMVNHSTRCMKIKWLRRPPFVRLKIIYSWTILLTRWRNHYQLITQGIFWNLFFLK